MRRAIWGITSKGEKLNKDRNVVLRICKICDCPHWLKSKEGVKDD